MPMKEVDAITTRRHLVIPCSEVPGKVVSGVDTVVTVVPIFVQFVLYEVSTFCLIYLSFRSYYENPLTVLLLFSCKV